MPSTAFLGLRLPPASPPGPPLLSTLVCAYLAGFSLSRLRSGSPDGCVVSGLSSPPILPRLTSQADLRWAELRAP